MAEIEFWKGGRKVAGASEVMTLIIEAGELSSAIGKIRAHYFPAVDMVPPVLFEHLAGRALMAFLDESEMVVMFDGEPPQHYPDLRYIHGRSEVMRGTPSVSAVLLASIKRKDDKPLSLAELVEIQPQLYKRYLETHGPLLENA